MQSLKQNLVKYLTLPSLLFLILFFVYPIILILTRSFIEPEVGIQNYINFFQESAYTKSLLNTIKIASLVTFFTFLVSYPIAYLAATTSSDTVRKTIFLCVILPFLVSLLVKTFALLVLLQNKGIINSLLISSGIIDSPLPLSNNLIGVLIGVVYIMIPFMVFPMYTTMSSIDHRLLDAASNLGANPFIAFIKVYFPLSIPGAAAGSVMVFSMTIGYYIIPAILGGTNQIMLGEFIANQIQSYLNWGIAATSGTILLVITMALFIIYLKTDKGDINS